MFSTRLTTVMLAIVIGWTFMTRDIPIPTLFILAITLASGALFMPMVAAVWLTRLPSHVPLTIMSAGAFVGTLEIWHGLFDGPGTAFASPAHAAFTVTIVGGVYVTGTKIANHVLKRNVPDPQATVLRGD